MRSLTIGPTESKVEETARGVWRRCSYPDGGRFVEFTSHRRLFGVPLLHFARGRNPETGRAAVARGIVAVGGRAVGIVALGQFAAGIISLGQFSLGVLLGLGQFTAGVAAVGQFAVSALVGLGQFAAGSVAVGQFGFGRYVLAQLGYGEHVWDTRGASPDAQQFFQSLLP